jgi:vacuolar iron transporter family protein
MDEKVHNTIAKRLRSLLFGVQDGIVSIWGLVLGVSAGTHDSFIVILAGLAGAIPAALSMAAGDYISSKSKREVQEFKINVFKNNIKKKKAVVMENLKRKYIHEGFTSKEVNPWLSRLKKDDGLLLRKCEEEYGINPDTFENPVHNAVAILFAFLVGSLVPLFPFIVFDITFAQYLSLGITIIALFGIGALKTKITKRPWWKSGTEMLLIGLAAALVGFLIGKVLGG